jgi:hypothetical protein
MLKTSIFAVSSTQETPVVLTVPCRQATIKEDAATATTAWQLKGTAPNSVEIQKASGESVTLSFAAMKNAGETIGFVKVTTGSPNFQLVEQP